jgi:D-alanine-D-alanine ligase
MNSKSDTKERIAVLLGGTSAERDVSLVTGVEIARALARRGHVVQAIDCAYGDKQVDFSKPGSGNAIHVEPSEIEKQQRTLNRNILKTIQYLLDEKFDLAFLALHGGYGENGQLQALLELAEIPYTGSRSLASSIGMDKHISKMLFEKNGVTTAEWIKIDSMDAFDSSNIEEMDYPVVVKPNNQGSTVGLTVVTKPGDAKAAVQKAFSYSHSVLVEKFIPGREITAPILGKDCMALIEVIPEHGIYDYECKYQSGKSQYVVPAPLPEEITAKIKQQAGAAYRAIGCRHYARADFRLSEKGTAYCLEVNTLPGMTPTSLVPKSAGAIGITFDDLVEKIAGMALKPDNR